MPPSPSNQKQIRILLADDHAIVRRGLQMVLSLENDLTIIGEASTGAEAVEMTRASRPDLVLMDLKMPGMTGSAATRLIKQDAPGTRVLILTGVDIDEEISRAVDAGADGYVLKDIEPDELVRAIRTVSAGESYLQPVVTRQLFRKLQGTGQGTEKNAPYPPLTARECQVLRLMATSATYREIAVQLVISEETVRSHTKNILGKLGQPNRTQAVLLALKEGLISLE